MKYIFILSVMLFSSCGKWQSFCCSKCDIQTKDSVWTKTDTIVDHDTIPVPYKFVEMDTVFDFSLCPPVHIVKKSNGVTGTLDISKGKVSLKCECDSSAIYRDYYSRNTTINSQKVETKLKDCNKEHRSKIDHFCRWWSLISLILIAITGIGYCYIRAVKK